MLKPWKTARSTMVAALSLLGVATSALSQPAGSRSHPHHARRSHRHPRTASVPTQPAAPTDQQASATTPAPVPNESVTPPIDHAAPSANVAPSVFQLHYPPQGEGYVTGSSSQAMDDRNAAKATGVEATIPLPH